jgi:hypothetical protein
VGADAGGPAVHSRDRSVGQPGILDRRLRDGRKNADDAFRRHPTRSSRPRWPLCARPCTWTRATPTGWPKN